MLQRSLRNHGAAVAISAAGALASVAEAEPRELLDGAAVAGGTTTAADSAMQVTDVFECLCSFAQADISQADGAWFALISILSLLGHRKSASTPGMKASLYPLVCR